MYGIKVPMAVDDYVWVIKKPDLFNPEVLTFETKEKAEEFVWIFGPFAEVHKYEPDATVA